MLVQKKKKTPEIHTFEGFEKFIQMCFVTKRRIYLKTDTKINILQFHFP